VAAIAERRLGRVFALAPPEGLFLGDFDFHRLQAGALVGAVAKRLVGGPAAGAPEIHPGFDFKRKRLGITYNRFLGHEGETVPSDSPTRDGNERSGGFAMSLTLKYPREKLKTAPPAERHVFPEE
jgi:hypothetical protein